MKAISFNGGYLTILVNKSTEDQSISLAIKYPGLKPSTIFANKGGSVSGDMVTIRQEETIVIEWE